MEFITPFLNMQNTNFLVSHLLPKDLIFLKL